MLKLQSPCKGKMGSIKDYTKDYRLTQEFGADFFVNGELLYKSMGYPGHMGIDFGGPRPGIKIPVYATEDGTCYIKDSGSFGYGKHIKLYFTQEGQNYRCIYGHLDSFSVSNRQEVKKGQQIGVMGTTGTSTAVHLHFDIVRCNSNWGVINTNDGYKGFFDPQDFMVEFLGMNDSEIQFMREKRKVLGEIYDTIDNEELRVALANVGKVMDKLGATRI